MEEIEAVIKKRAVWILKQQRVVCYLPHLPPRQYVSGESHRYLGRQYRLKVNEGPEKTAGVVQTRNTLEVTVADPATPRACQVPARRLVSRPRRRGGRRAPGGVLSKDSTPRPAVSAARGARDALTLGKLRSGYKITLNIKLILVPEELIDYVIYHELCHLKEHHHGKAFYQLLDRVLPEWRERKRKLEEFDFG